MGNIKTLLTILVMGMVFFWVMNAYDLTYTGSVTDRESLNTRVVLQQQDALLKEYNANLQNVPNFIKTVFGDARVSVEIEMQDGTIVKRQVTTRKGKIITVVDGAFPKPDYKVWTTERALDKMLTSDKPAEEFALAVKNEDVTIKAMKIMGSAKVFVGRLVVNVYTLL